MAQRDAHTPLDTGPPPAHPSISPATVRALVDDQDPDYHELELGERFDGWDMAMYRLGERLAVRLPRVESAVDSLIAETRFVPRLSGEWDFPFPRVVRSGLPGHGYPWPWAIVSWVPSETADKAPLNSEAGPAMGRAIAQIHRSADADAPYNPEQSLPMAGRGADLAWALEQLDDARGPDGETLDLARISRLWDAALDAPAGRDVVWSHADLHGSNVLSADGDFAGIIDWGKMAGCDRAVDLGFLYTVMPHAGVIAAVHTYREATGIEDPGLEARLTGIGLSKCLLWATLDRPLNLAMAWRGLHELGVLVPA